MELSVASVLAQWSVGGLAFLWVTSRRRVVGLGYGWLLRGVYAALALGGLLAALGSTRSGAGHALFLAGSAGVVLGALAALAVSVVRRAGGVSGQEAERARRRARVAAMTATTSAAAASSPSAGEPDALRTRRPEFPPVLDLVAPLLGIVALVGASLGASADPALALFRLLAGAALLGSVTDAMLLGHWYLVQPGLSRAPITELVRLVVVAWPFELVAYLIPPGAVQILTGAVADGYHGLLGWMWLASAITTLVLAMVTLAALRERSYSAVMAATGLLYLAILTAFGMDLIPRAVLPH